MCYYWSCFIPVDREEVKKMNKKGLGFMPVLGIIVGLLIVVGLAVTVTLFSAGTLSVGGVVIPVEADGEFDDSSLPEEVGGTDLTLNTTYSVTSEVFTVAYDTDGNINGTDGNNHVFAFNFEVSGGDLEDFTADIKLGTTIATTELKLKNAYIMLDEKGLTLDRTNALGNFIVDVDTALDKIDIEADFVEDGEYILVIEAKSLATVTIALGETLMTVEFDATSDDSDATDDGTVTIRNIEA